MQAVPLIFVLYDSIENSVFSGQVLEPLVQKVQENEHLKVTIVSFEHSKPSKEKIDKIQTYHDRISLQIIHKLPFIGSLSLAFAARALKKILKPFQFYSIIARGPLAGLISKKALNQKKCTSLIIQARGLLAAEYDYAQSGNKNVISRLIHALRIRQLTSVEQAAFTHNNFMLPVTIEAVSQALKEYIFNTYGTNPNAITIANADIPKPIAQEQCLAWKTATRTQWNVPLTATIYCYNGSIKPWQCPEKVISFFKKQLETTPSSFLLVLSQDCEQFQALLKESRLPGTSYKVMHVPHKDIYQYLAACDTGILFRENHIVNWVSRPTKALEYEVAGLKVLHNNTVAWLTDTK